MKQMKKLQSIHNATNKSGEKNVKNNADSIIDEPELKSKNNKKTKKDKIENAKAQLNNAQKVIAALPLDKIYSALPTPTQARLEHQVKAHHPDFVNVPVADPE